MALAAVSAAVGLSGVSQRNQPWVSMVAFSADMYRLWRFSMTHCASSFRGGIRQKERGWLHSRAFGLERERQGASEGQRRRVGDALIGNELGEHAEGLDADAGNGENHAVVGAHALVGHFDVRELICMLEFLPVL